MSYLNEQHLRWARLPYPLLILGERGTGKSALAETLHRASGRSGRFVARSLAHLSPGLELAALAGHKRGAFTGATADRAGDLRTADGGTLLLDELGRARNEVQGMLLDLVEHGSFTPLGSSVPEHVDVRLIAATNADLSAMVAVGAFAADLLDRFGYFVIHLPPLRERRAEILPLLAAHLIKAGGDIGRAEPPELERSLASMLEQAPWPGNIRDIVKLAQYLATNAGDVARLGDLPPGFPDRRGQDRRTEGDRKESRRDTAWRAVQESAENKSKAARRLGISRTQLYRLLGERKPADGAEE